MDALLTGAFSLTFWLNSEQTHRRFYADTSSSYDFKLVLGGLPPLEKLMIREIDGF